MRNLNKFASNTFSNKFSYFNKSSPAIDSSSFKYTKSALKSTFHSGLTLAIWYHLSADNKEKIAKARSSSGKGEILFDEMNKITDKLNTQFERMDQRYDECIKA